LRDEIHQAIVFVAVGVHGYRELEKAREFRAILLLYSQRFRESDMECSASSLGQLQCL
jgi:hypothetical protein